MQDNQIAREISYANGASTRSGRVVIRAMENATGRLKLIRRVRGYADEVEQGNNFWQVICDRYGLTLDVVGGSLDNIPSEGPLIIVSNHPFGILDGLLMGRILSERRPDFKLMAHRIFCNAAELENVILPISFDTTKEAARLNIKTRAEALNYLKDGGAVGVFPGGTVSTSSKAFEPPMDPVWRSFTAKMIGRSGATVVPIFFEGQNSRLFQMASLLHNTLRLGLYIREFKMRVDNPVKIVVGAPISAAQLTADKLDPATLMDNLRKTTYNLSPKPVQIDKFGLETEEWHRQPRAGTR